VHRVRSSLDCVDLRKVREVLVVGGEVYEGSCLDVGDEQQGLLNEEGLGGLESVGGGWDLLGVWSSGWGRGDSGGGRVREGPKRSN
jgi:hypothetical protein